MTDKANILLVDDRRENLLALEAILTKLEQNLVQASSGGEALKFLLKNDAAVILLDVDMPHMDGFQTATLIREREKTRHTPIIFLTAISKSDVQVTQGYSLGGIDYIFKPFQAEVLRSKVSAFVEMYKQRQQVQSQTTMLKAERDFADAILDTVAGFLLVLDPQGRIVRVNRAFEEALGVTTDEATGHFFHEYLEERETVQYFLKEGRGPSECREYWLTNGSVRRLVSWCCTALSKEVAGTGRLVVTGRDMTELRKRTEELEAFTYSVSHDLRAPIRHIGGFVRLLEERDSARLSDEGRRYLTTVRQSAHPLGALAHGRQVAAPLVAEPGGVALLEQPHEAVDVADRRPQVVRDRVGE